MAKSSEIERAQPEKNAQSAREDEILRRMLNTPPKPHKPKKDSKQEDKPES